MKKPYPGGADKWEKDTGSGTTKIEKLVILLSGGVWDGEDLIKLERVDTDTDHGWLAWLAGDSDEK